MSHPKRPELDEEEDRLEEEARLGALAPEVMAGNLVDAIIAPPWPELAIVLGVSLFVGSVVAIVATWLGWLA